MRVQFLSLALAGLCWASVVPARAHDHEHMMPMQAGQPLSGASLYNLDARWTDQDGKAIQLKDLRGMPVVVAMAYTSCKDICPLIVANMVAIENAAKAKKVADIRFAFFSLDSAVDTPTRLKAYADERGLDPAQWSLYHGDDKAVRDLAAALGVRYRRDDKGGFDHSAAITLLDGEGEIVFQKADAKLDIDEFVTKIEGLKKK
ncbi:SCO family protein [Rhodoblastus sp.]|uniref:SCO family protein n=1 Tax=Rhodoblastus sp. TaxID=1962975 RepID=UPI002600943B|nr:SCO family protein [Rhodoblastus sp.]